MVLNWGFSERPGEDAYKHLDKKAGRRIANTVNNKETNLKRGKVDNDFEK